MLNLQGFYDTNLLLLNYEIKGSISYSNIALLVKEVKEKPS